MCIDFKMLKVKVPMNFFGTPVFSARRDRRYWTFSHQLRSCLGLLLPSLQKRCSSLSAPVQSRSVVIFFVYRCSCQPLAMGIWASVSRDSQVGLNSCSFALPQRFNGIPWVKRDNSSKHYHILIFITTHKYFYSGEHCDFLYLCLICYLFDLWMRPSWKSSYSNLHSTRSPKSLLIQRTFRSRKTLHRRTDTLNWHASALGQAASFVLPYCMHYRALPSDPRTRSCQPFHLWRVSPSRGPPRNITSRIAPILTLLPGPGLLQ